jgi:hypothetical protein
MSLEIAIDGGGRSSVHPVYHPQGAGGLPQQGAQSCSPQGEVETFDDRVFETLATMSELFVCGLRGKPKREAGLTMAG